jgi:hypothetical protein
MKFPAQMSLLLAVALSTGLAQSAQIAPTSLDSATQNSQSQTAPAQTSPTDQGMQGPPPQQPAQPAPPQSPSTQSAPAPSSENASPQPTQPQTPPAATSPPPEPYKAKFPGDPARSESEAQALGYMRVVLRAEQLYKKRHDKYATSLTELAGTGSFTRRMAKTTDRGDYSVGFRPHKDGFILVMTPKQMDEQRRSFYAEEDAVIHADDQKPADANSPRIK